MKRIPIIVFMSMFCLWSCQQQNVQAQVPPGMDMDDYDIPANMFPTAPNQEIATAVVKYNVDYMGFNPGKNHIHTERITKIKIYSWADLKEQRYALYAEDSSKNFIPIALEPSPTKKGCVFATIGNDWVNIFCSDLFKFDPVFQEETINKLRAERGLKPLPSTLNKQLWSRRPTNNYVANRPMPSINDTPPIEKKKKRKKRRKRKRDRRR